MMMIKNLVASYVLYPIAERMEKRDVRGKLKKLHHYYSHAFLLREALAKKALYEQVSFAQQKVPYYRDLFQKIQFNPAKLERDIGYLNEIPFLDKNIILEQGERLLVEDHASHKKYPCKTGGSTGKSVVIYYDQAASDWSAATTLYARELCGNRRHKKELHLSSELPHIITRKDQFRENMKCLSMNRTNVFYAAFDEASLERILSEIKKAKTHLVHGHPSTMYHLALAAKKYQKGKKLFSVFESSGEYLSEKKAQVIQETFGCKIINRYGLAEAGVIAYQRDNDTESLAVFDHQAWPESVLNEIVITNLNNQLMPLLRYKTGDLGNIERNEAGFLIKNLRGRVHDSVVINGTVYLTHYIQDLLDRFGGVSDFQITTKDKTPFLRIVSAENINKENFIKEYNQCYNKIKITY